MYCIFFSSMLPGINSITGAAFCGNGRLFMRITGAMTFCKLISSLSHCFPIPIFSRLGRTLRSGSLYRTQSRRANAVGQFGRAALWRPQSIRLCIAGIRLLHVLHCAPADKGVGRVSQRHRLNDAQCGRGYYGSLQMETDNNTRNANVQENEFNYGVLYNEIANFATPIALVTLYAFVVIRLRMHGRLGIRSL